MKIHTLKRKAEFATTLNSGKKFVKDSFILLYHPENQSDIKLGIISSKRVLRLATQRNKARRRIRAAFRKAINKNETLKGNFVFIVRNKILSEKFESIANAIVKTLQTIYIRPKP